MAIKHLSTLEVSGKDENLQPVTNPPSTLIKSYDNKVALIEKVTGPLTRTKQWFGTTKVTNKGGLYHKPDAEFTEVRLYRALLTSDKKHQVVLEWREGVSTSGTAWWVSVNGSPKVVLPSLKWTALIEKLKG